MHCTMQVAVLANIPEQQASGDTASEDDMGEELQACLAGSEEAESAPAKPVSHATPSVLLHACRPHSYRHDMNGIQNSNTT